MILSAGFGEGHNSAASNTIKALGSNISSELIDPCALGSPYINDKIRHLYRFITTHAPWIWKKVYYSTEKQDFSKSKLPLMQKPEELLSKVVLERKPKVIVSTYPLYPYFLERIYKKTGFKATVITVVTDSIEINAAWRKAPTDYWIVTDKYTRQSMINHGIAEHKVIETGFPVHPHFADLKPIHHTDKLKPFRMLYFPTAKRPHVRRISKELLHAAGDNSELTIVLGRNVKKLNSRAQEIKQLFPGRVKIKGWTKKVPELFNSHHLAIAKAGGATVHEALAATCPMLIHHLVPGQEEGNLALLRKLNGGTLADKPSHLSQQIKNMLADDASNWRAMKQSLATHSRPSAAMTLSHFILSELEKNSNS